MIRFTLILSLCCLFIVTAASDGLVNTKVTRRLDLKTQLVKHTVEVVISNEGQATDKYLLCLDESDEAKLSYLSVTDKESGAKLAVKKNPDKAKRKGTNRFMVFYEVALGKSLKTSDTMTIKVGMIFTHQIEPYPNSITQSERQLVRYKGNHFFASPYKTKEQTTNVKLASSSVQSNSDHPPTSVKGDSIKYGPYNDVPAYAESHMVVHYENNSPFVTVKSVDREIEVSHWGNIFVEESYKISHDGAALRGSFSRYEYQINPQANGQAAIKSMTQYLAPNVANVYYRDAIGNISTSHMGPKDVKGARKQQLEFEPRFPLFGGWKTEWLLGYSEPLENGLFRDASDSSFYMLNMTFGPHWVQNVVVDSAVVKVVLPEGATNIKLHKPFEGITKTSDIKKSYLDSQGRPVVVMEASNIVNQHNLKYFQITYNYGSMDVLREPLMVITAWVVILVAFIFFSRFEMRIK